MSRMSTLTKKQKTVIGVVALALAVAIAIAVIILIWSPWKKDDPQDTSTTTTAETTNTTAAVTDNSVVIQTSGEQQKGEESTTESEWKIEPRLVLYFKTESGFADAEFTDKISAVVDEAKALKFSDVARNSEGERQYIEPEVRLYGVPLGAYVSVTCESMVTKAEYLFVGQNDGAYQYYYWQPRLYSVSEQGEYTFKITIKETETSTTEKVIYYKIAV